MIAIILQIMSLLTTAPPVIYIACLCSVPTLIQHPNSAHLIPGTYLSALLLPAPVLGDCEANHCQHDYTSQHANDRSSSHTDA